MKKYLLGIMAVAIALGAVAFTPKPAKFAAGYRYNSSSTVLANVQNVSANWSYSATPSGCSVGENLPCIFNRASQDDATFQTYLNGFSTVADITTAADVKKP